MASFLESHLKIGFRGRKQHFLAILSIFDHFEISTMQLLNTALLRKSIHQPANCLQVHFIDHICPQTYPEENRGTKIYSEFDRPSVRPSVRNENFTDRISLQPLDQFLQFEVHMKGISLQVCPVIVTLSTRAKNY